MKFKRTLKELNLPKTNFVVLEIRFRDLRKLRKLLREYSVTFSEVWAFKNFPLKTLIVSGNCLRISENLRMK